MHDKLQAWIDKLNDWGARLADNITAIVSPQPKPVPIRIKDDRPITSRRRSRHLSLASGSALALSLLIAPASAAPIAKKPVAAATTHGGIVAHPAAAPRPAVKAVVQLGATFSSSDLDRIFVGNQAGLLKVYGPDKKTVVFIKDVPGSDMLGVDDSSYAPVADKHRKAIFGALSITDGEGPSISHKIIENYKSIANSRNAIAMLGVIGSTPISQLTPTAAAEIRQFLSGLLTSSKDVAVRRHAVLALAICSEIDETTVKSVITFMASSHNAWETFTTRQFFTYHKDFIRSLPDAIDLKHQLEASGNPYSADIATLFN